METVIPIAAMITLVTLIIGWQAVQQQQEQEQDEAESRRPAEVPVETDPE